MSCKPDDVWRQLTADAQQEIIDQFSLICRRLFMTSELIKTQHLRLKAIIYIRQSTPNQMFNNQESLELQYALKARAVELGWSPPNIEVIDKDLGLTGTAISHRAGFKEMLSQVGSRSHRHYFIL